MPKSKAPVEPLTPRSPRLSVDLPYARHPHRCQGCGAAGLITDGTLSRYVEHDHHDKPEPIVVLLCSRCSKQLIKKHPRLYHQLNPFDRYAGAMELCVGCVWRRGLLCSHRDARRNGGPGVQIGYKAPAPVALVNFGGGRGGPVRLHTGPPLSCSGQELDQVPPRPEIQEPETQEDYAI